MQPVSGSEHLTLHQASSESLSTSFRAALRSMLEQAFDGDFSDDDWKHALGGVHVWLADGDRVRSHAAVVERRLVCGGEQLRVGYVEAVATAARHRHRGFGSMVVTQAGELIRERFALGALSTGSHAFYQRLGWERWRGRTFADGPHGRERTAADDGSVMILQTPRTPQLDIDAEIVCDWRAGELW